MFTGIKTTLESYGVSLDNCVSIALDNTNANMGSKNSLRTRLERENPSIYVVGCVCHILHNASCHGCRTLTVSLLLELVPLRASVSFYVPYAISKMLVI